MCILPTFTTADRLDGAVVRVGNDATGENNPACTGAVTAGQISAGQDIAVSCDLVGQYISVHLSNEALTLCEVKAYHGACAGV